MRCLKAVFPSLALTTIILGSSVRADYVGTVLADNPLAYYRFEEEPGASQIVDSSGNGHDSVDVLNAEFGVEGVHGSAVNFMGDGSILLDFAMDPTDPEGDGPGSGRDDFSIETWINFNIDAPTQVFISQQDGAGLGRSDMLRTANNSLGSYLGGGTSNSDVLAEADTWYHFVMTYDGELIPEPINFYVDGEWAGSSTRVAEFADGDWVIGSHKSQTSQFTDGRIDEVSFYDYRLDDPNGDDDTSDSRVMIHFEGSGGGGKPALQAGDSNMDYQFNQLDLVQVQIAAKYLSGQAATWGEGDWDGAPGGEAGNPPMGNGRFDQLDIIAALGAGKYLAGPYAAVEKGGLRDDDTTTIIYDPATGELAVDAPANTELTSINIDSAAAIFTGAPAENLGGSFDNDADNNIFKATFGSSFGSLSFGTVAQAGLSEDFVANDLTVVGSLAGGGDLGAVDLIYVPEPSSLLLALLGIVGLLHWRR